MTPSFRRLGPSELLPRYIFAEGLLARRRVLEIGAVATTGGTSARFLLTRGARLVLAADEDAAAIAEAQRVHQAPGLRFRACVFDDLEPGSFDAVLIADLAPYVAAPALFAELARLVAPQGVLLGGLRNPGGLALAQLMEAEQDAPPTYGQLLDVASQHFPSVEVATQSPVLGYQLAFDTSDGLQVDGTLADAGESAYFVVFCGQQPLRQLDPTWVQLPPEPLAFTRGKLEEVARRGKGWEERAGTLKQALGKVGSELEQHAQTEAFLRRELEE